MSETTAPERPAHIDYDNPSVDFKVEVVRIGPDEAQRILEGSKYNRTISPATVRKYVRDMRAKKWWFNAQPIILNGIVDQDAELLNGAHRLNAVIEANVTIPFLFVKGIEPSSIRTMDTGKPRNFTQMLEIDGENASKVLGPMIQYLKAFRDHESFKGSSYSTLELYDVLKNEPSTKDIAPKYQRRLPGNMPQGLLAVLEYLFAEKDPAQAQEFCHAVATGENLEKDHPAYVVREWLNRAEKEEKKTVTIGNALIEHWNRFRRGEKMTRVRLPKDCPPIE